MNNRQAALIAATNIITNVTEATEYSRVLQLWLDELDTAEAESRLPASFPTVRKVGIAALEWAEKQGSPATALTFRGELPNLTLANGKTYDWHGSWSRVS